MARTVVNEKGFKLLEHTADAYVAAYGKDLAEAFENAARALFNVMTELEKISTDVVDYVEVSGDSETTLLYNWLEALIVKSEINGTLYSKFQISILDGANNSYQLKAKIWGEKFSADKHLQKVSVKAITYHRMEITKEKDKVTLKFILDI